MSINSHTKILYRPSASASASFFRSIHLQTQQHSIVVPSIMQFFHLFSLVVVASYAAARPQPAGLSEKYSNNADTNLVSILSARSYQPGLNSYKELATSTLLKRRDNSEGSAEVDSGSGSSPSPDTTPNDSEESSEVDSGSGSSPSPDTTPNDSEGSSEVDSGSDSSPSPDTTPNDSEGSSEVDSGSDSSPSPDTTPNDSEGSSEVDSGSDSSPSPDTTPEKKFSLPFTEETVNSMALASTINNVGDGIVGFYEDADKSWTEASWRCWRPAGKVS
ncbi:hypothetical protein BASA61_001817 [Batrachochytrium salamandrivorans]|nr:hypothetical protein BASA61_001817 [Batrachochytrium salamandrivorans]